MNRSHAVRGLKTMALLVPALLVTSMTLAAQSVPPEHTGSTGGTHIDLAIAEVEDALRSFLRAFNDLDWESFRHHFEDGATVFHPLPNAPMRDDGREAFEASFGSFFDAVRAAQQGPPYLNIDPHELRIQLLGDVAVATFHLWPEAPTVGRRTVVLRVRDGRWRIAHLHASLADR